VTGTIVDVVIEDSGLPGLAADRGLVSRKSTAERVAGVLRKRIAEGYFLPAGRLSEQDIGNALGVSRNTLREAFRLLTHERLLVHELNRGVFVRVVTVEDLDDIYRVRTLVECAAVRGLGEGPYAAGTAEAIEAIEAAVVAVKGAIEGEDAEAITAKTNELAQAAMKLGEAMYQASQAQGGGDAGPGATGGAEAGGQKADDNVVDAQFEEVDDKKKKSA